MFPIITDSDTPYDCNTLIQQLPAYNSSQGNDSLLDLARMVNESDNYMWIGGVFPAIPTSTVPGQPPTNLAANATINGTLALPVGTYIISLQFYCSRIGVDPAKNYGIKVKLSDKGTKASIFYGDYALDDLVMSPMDIDVTPNEDVPFGPAYLKSPFIITPPGNLNWEIVNMGPSDVLVQIMCQCATPVNNTSLNTRDIQTTSLK